MRVKFVALTAAAVLLLCNLGVAAAQANDEVRVTGSVVDEEGRPAEAQPGSTTSFDVHVHTLDATLKFDVRRAAQASPPASISVGLVMRDPTVAVGFSVANARGTTSVLRTAHGTYELNIRAYSGPGSTGDNELLVLRSFNVAPGTTDVNVTFPTVALAWTDCETAFVECTIEIKGVGFTPGLPAGVGLVGQLTPPTTLGTIMPDAQGELTAQLAFVGPADTYTLVVSSPITSGVLAGATTNSMRPDALSISEPAE